MRLYKIFAKSDRDDGNQPVVEVIWVGTQGDAAKARKKLVAEGFKRAEIETLEVDVPTNKEGLLKFLNDEE